MAPSTSTSKFKTTKEKKEKVFHPQSRKAGQLERAQLRKAKLASLSTKKAKKDVVLIDRFVFFYHAIPPEETAITLSQLHEIVREIWLKRHDLELERERSARRKGRPKSSRQMMLENIVLRETEDYRAGFEVPDLTHAPTVTLFRRWGQTDIEYLNLLRFIRISSQSPDAYIVSRLGKHDSMLQMQAMKVEDHMEISSNADGNLQSEQWSRVSSTMQTMDEGPAA